MSIIQSLSAEDCSVTVVTMERGDDASFCHSTMPPHQTHNLLVTVAKKTGMMVANFEMPSDEGVFLSSGGHDVDVKTKQAAEELNSDLMILVVQKEERSCSAYIRGLPMEVSHLAMRSAATLEVANQGPFMPFPGMN